MSRLTSPATAKRRALAASLGISTDALRNRKRRETLKRLAQHEPTTWIGARIWPPIEDGHPLLCAAPIQHGKNEG